MTAEPSSLEFLIRSHNPTPTMAAGIGFSLSQRPQAYLKKSVPGETEASMLRTSGSCSGESVGPPARAGATPATSTIDTRSAPSGRANGEVQVIRIPFVEG